MPFEPMGTTVTVAAALVAPSAVDVAVTVTAPGVEGAVKTAGEPLAVWAGTIAPALTDQSTPADESSLATLAVKLTLWLMVRVAGTLIRKTLISGLLCEQAGKDAMRKAAAAPAMRRPSGLFTMPSRSWAGLRGP